MSRRQPEVLICIKASALGFDAIAGIAASRSMPRSSPMPDSIAYRPLVCAPARAGSRRRGSRHSARPKAFWLGTPFNLNLSRESGALERRMARDQASHSVLWGEKDGWIAAADLKATAAAMPDCRLIPVPGIGHSMNLESPARYAGYLAHGSAGSRK